MEENNNGEDRIENVNIEDEMKSAYIDYSMSVIVARALPDVRDGLKPVHRRVLFGMNGLGLSFNKPQKKSARIVGEVLGKYHPHGDTSVYDAMVRMAQDWSLRYPLVDGQGNFGSVDGDSPAAMRYTEARLKKISDEILSDIDKETVDWRLNFDDSLQEPTVLPSKIPTLLINGATGIAVGMATNMLPHNLTEVVNGTLAYIDNEEITIKELTSHIKAPDFPTGGTIYGMSGVYQGFETGRGRVVVRGRADVEETKTGRTIIIVSEIPYMVNKATMIQKTAALINEKKIEGISDIRDESDRRGMRIVYVLKKDANPNVVLNQLYKHTYLQTSYGINNVCLVNGRPRILNLKELIHYFVEFRHEVVVKRTEYELRQAEERAHILEGLLIAIDNLDAVIKLIRASATPDEAKQGLMSSFGLSEIQAKAILDMRLQKLTGLERAKIKEEYEALMATINGLKEILANKGMRMDIIKEELIEIREKYGDERRTDITIDDSEFAIEDIIDNEKMVVTISHKGYIKRTSLAEYKEQNRGGKGSKGGGTRSEDFIEDMFSTSTHNYLLFFTEGGRCHWIRVYQLPEGNKTAKGRPIQNLIQLPNEEKVLAYINVPNLKDEEFLDNNFIVFATKNGTIKKTSLRSYSRIRQNGINAITIREGDRLVECKLTDGTCDILVGSKQGKVVRFHESKIKSVGRTSIGVKGMTLAKENDEVIAMIVVPEAKKDTSKILVVSERGYGKKSLLEDYRLTNRGGKGVKTIKVTEKTGTLVALKEADDDGGLMIINKSGLTIRMTMSSISTLGRNTQGVKLININDGDEIASVAKVPLDDKDPEVDEDGNPIIQLDEDGNPIVPLDEDGNPITPVAEEGQETAAEGQNDTKTDNKADSDSEDVPSNDLDSEEE